MPSSNEEYERLYDDVKQPMPLWLTMMWVLDCWAFAALIFLYVTLYQK